MHMTISSIAPSFPIMLPQANLTIVAPPNASSTIPRSSTDPLVQVKPNSTDVFFVAASALMGAVFHGCGEYTIPLGHKFFLTNHNDIFPCKLSASLMMCKHGLLLVALARVGGIDDSCGGHVHKGSIPCPLRICCHALSWQCMLKCLSRKAPSAICHALLPWSLQDCSACADADWHCHSMDCDLPEEVVEKRTGVCCPTVSPMLTAISRQVHRHAILLQLSMHSLGAPL